MKGQHQVIVQNRRVQYKFTINRNLTILRGDSATGKTTLIEMIADYQRRGEESGITVKCDKSCVVLDDTRWKLILANTHDSIVFIDEGNDFIRQKEFAEMASQNDNYFVIASRNPLPMLPYSVQEVYGIRNKSGNRYQSTKRLYSEFYPLFAPSENQKIDQPDCIIVEDSHAGYEFFADVCKRFSIVCLSSDGNARMEFAVNQCEYEKILAIADGAAFGPYVEKLLNLSQVKQLGIYLPESFEWMILKSGMLKEGDISRILENPSEFIDSKEYFSWEQFFTSLLVNYTRGTYLAYNKAKLNSSYLQEYESNTIMRVMPIKLRKTLNVVAAVIFRDGKIFATQRGYGEFKDGWEFPGGKVKDGETPQEALKREIREELDTEILAGKEAAKVEYDYPDFHLSMTCYWCTVKSGDLILKEHEAARWLGRDELSSVDWLPADLEAIRRISDQWIPDNYRG